MTCRTKPYNPCPSTPNAKCIIYTGTNLTNISILTNDRLDVILQKINDSISEGFDLYTEDTSSIQFTGDGTSQHPLMADVVLSSEPNNSLLSLTDGLFNPNSIQQGVVYGGIVTWIDNYNYHVSPAGYYINGVFYESPANDFTLTSPDPVDNRIDTFIVDITGVASVLEGTPSSNPSQAPLDPATQLQLSLALVEVGTVEPTLGVECVYKENTEWTAVSSNISKINPDSINNPCVGGKSIEFTSMNNGNNILFSRGSSFTPAGTYTQINFLIKSKGVWTGVRQLRFQWQLSGVGIGGSVTLVHGSYGWNSADTTTCQVVSIPLSAFGLGVLTSVDQFKITAVTTGSATIPGCYMDNLCLQDTVIVAPPTTPDEKVKVSSNDLVAGYLNGKLVAGTGVTFTELNNGANETLVISASSPLTFDNALTKTLNNVQLGGPLVQNTSIELDAYGLNFLDTAGGGFIQILPGSVSGVGTLFSILSDIGTTNSIFSQDGTQIVLQGNTPASTETYELTIAAGVSNLRYSNGTDTYRVGVGTNAGGTGIELFGLSNTATQDRLVGITSTTDIAGYITIGSGLSLASGVLSSTAVASITADNGLTANTSTNVRLGGSPLMQTTSIPTSTFNFTMTSSNAGHTFRSVNTNDDGAAIKGDGTGLVTIGVHGTSTNQTGVQGTGGTSGVFGISTNGSGLSGNSTNGYGATLTVSPSVSNTVSTILRIRRENGGGAGANGIGGAIDFAAETTGSSVDFSNNIVSKWVDATTATRTSQFIITGVNSAVTADLFTLSGSGATRLNKYGVGSFTAGTPAYGAAWDASGNFMEVSLSGGTYTASNGLTMTANNTVLGGTLLQTTNVVVNSQDFSFQGSGSNIVYFNDGAIDMTNNNNTIPLLIKMETSNNFTPTFITNKASTNDIKSTLKLRRNTTGTAAPNLGTSIDYEIEADDGNIIGSNSLISRLTTVTGGATVSQFIITGINSAVSADLLTLSGSGALKLNKYGVNTFAGVAAYVIGVDASGNLVEVAAAGAGMSNPFTTNGDTLYAVGTTPTRLPIGAPGQVYTVNGGGTAPEWTTVAGTGSVTDFVFTDANGVDGTVTSSTTIPTLSLAFTPNGMLKSNGTALSAAVAGTDYLTPTGSAASLTSFPTLNQNTTGSAATLTTSRNIQGVAFNGSANIDIINGTGFVKATGTTLSYDNSTYVTTNLYAASGTLAGDRTITLNGNYLRALQGATEFFLIEPTANNETVLLQASNATGAGNTAGYLSTTTATQAESAIISDFNGSTTRASITLTSDASSSIAVHTADSHEFNGTIDFNSLAGNGSGVVAVDNNGLLSWASAAGTGTVTSVSGGTTGLTFATATTTPVMSGTLLVVNGGTGQSSYVIGDILQASSTTALSKLAAVATGNVLISGGVGVASSWGKVGLTTHVTGDLPFANLTQGSARSVLGVTGNSTADVASIQGTANQILRIDTAGTALLFGSINLASSAAVGTSILPTVNGGTGQTTYTNGQLLIGNTTGSTLTKATLTAGSGMTITNGAGSITIASSFNSSRQTLTDASTITWNINSGEAAVVTLGNINRTLSITNPVAGRTYIIEIIQDGSGNRTISTWPTGTTWVGGAPTLSSLPGQVDVVSFYWNGTNYRAVFNGPFA